MLWGNIQYDASTKLVPIPRLALMTLSNVEDILEAHAVPSAPFIGPNCILMHDDAWPHSAEALRDYLKEFSIRKFD